MREIKFRFWSNLLNHFVVPQDDIFVGALKDKDMIVMQFTGLKDREGKEVYEGDILDFMTAPDPKDKRHNIPQYRFWIEWGDCSWRMAGAPVPAHFYSENAANSVVIGNIYENKDLLKQ